MTAIERLRALEKKWRLEVDGSDERELQEIGYDACLLDCADELSTLIAELGQEAGAVVDDAINIPKAKALIAAVGPGYRVIYRDAFRWKDERGEVLPNHYEMFSAASLAADFGYELVLNLGYAAILRDTKSSPAHTSEARDAARLDWLEKHGCWQFAGPSESDIRGPAYRWFDYDTDGHDYSATLREAIDAAIAAEAK